MPQFPERLPDEPELWYRRLCDYCAQDKRSILALYNAEQEKARKGKIALSPPSSWGKATEAWRWTERVRAYDIETARECAAQIDDQRRVDLETLRKQAQEDAHTLRELARKLAEKLQARVDSISANAIEPQQLAPILRSIGASLEGAANLDAAALGVAQVLEHLESLDDGDESDPVGPEESSRRVG